MSAERSTHIAIENVFIAATSGVLIGGGIVFPPAAIIGGIVGMVGVGNERQHQHRVLVNFEINHLQDSFSEGSSMRGLK